MMGLNTVDPAYAKNRVAGLDAQIKALRDQIKKLTEKRDTFKKALDATPEADSTTPDE